MSLLSPGDIHRMNGTLVEVSNATLTKITAPGTTDRYGDPGAGSDLWTGSADGFLFVRDRDVIDQGAQMRDRRATFEVYDAEGASVLEVAGPDWTATTVVIEDRRSTPSVTRRFSVTGMEHQADGTLDSVRLELDQEATVS